MNRQENSKSALVKELALKGAFLAIDKNYGDSAGEKARAWALQESDDGLKGNQLATPFMIFALNHKADNLTLDRLSSMFESELDLSNSDSSQAVSQHVPSNIIADTSKRKKELMREVSQKKIRRSPLETTNLKIDAKEVSKKKRKDPNHPKGPKNGYMFFSSFTRQELATDNPSMTICEQGKELGRQWQVMTASDKKMYVDMAEADKRRYMQEMEAYREDHPEYEEEEPQMRKRQVKQKKKSGRSDKTKDIRQAEVKHAVIRKLKKRSSREQAGEDSASGGGGENLSGYFAEEGGKEDQQEAVDARNKKKKKSLMSSSSAASLHREDKTTTSASDDDGGEEEDSAGESGDEDDEDYCYSSVDSKGSVTTTTPRIVRNKTASGNTRCDPPVTGKKGAARRTESLLASTPSAPHEGKGMRTKKTKGSGRVTTVDLDIKAIAGIKQKDIPKEFDLKHMRQIPRETGSFPADEGVCRPGQRVALVVASYREFISSLSQSILSLRELEEVQSVCECVKSEIVFGTVETVKSVPCGRRETISVLTVRVTGELAPKGESDFVKSAAQEEDRTFEIAYVAAASPLLVSDRFLMPRAHYFTSMGSPWLVVNAQVKRLFASSTGPAQVYEGSIYYIRKNWQVDPFNSIKVAWVVQDADLGPSAWVYDYIQTDNECSPWDLSLSSYVLPENVRPPSLPPDLLRDKPTPEAVLAYISGLDFSYVFKYQVSAIEEYCALFTEECDQLDLVVLAEQCKSGRFKDARGQPFSGLMLLFEELQVMVRNCKIFNDDNREFQTWRCADMMEEALFSLLEDLATIHSIPCLQDAVEQSRRAKMQEETRQEIEM